MNPKNKAERIVALDAIKEEAQNLASSGADSLDVQAFVSGAQKELVNQSPDTETYRKAATVAKKAKGS
jgi:hypothetical protein